MTIKEGALIENPMFKEPEAAGAWILLSFGEAFSIGEQDNIIFFDIGGGTVDCSPYEVSRIGDSFRLDRELAPPTGDACGEFRINEAFEAMLNERLGPVFDDIEKTTGWTKEQILDRLLGEFERFKRRIDVVSQDDNTKALCKRRLAVPGRKPNDKLRLGHGEFKVTRIDLKKCFMPWVESVQTLLANQIRECRQRGEIIEKAVSLGGGSDGPTIKSALLVTFKIFKEKGETPKEIRLLRPETYKSRQTCSFYRGRDPSFR